MTIGLLRHGQVVGGQRFRGTTDDPLTAEGLTAMYQAVANGPQWQRIISSPLVRCAEFAQAYGEQLDIPVQLDPRWQELDFGRWEGLSAAEVAERDEAALTQFWQDPAAHPPPAGESMEHFTSRLKAAWQQQSNTQDAVLIVTHGGAIRILLCLLQQKPIQNWHEIDVGYGQLMLWENQ